MKTKIIEEYCREETAATIRSFVGKKKKQKQRNAKIYTKKNRMKTLKTSKIKNHKINEMGGKL